MSGVAYSASAPNLVLQTQFTRSSRSELGHWQCWAAADFFMMCHLCHARCWYDQLHHWFQTLPTMVTLILKHGTFEWRVEMLLQLQWVKSWTSKDCIILRSHLDWDKGCDSCDLQLVVYIIYTILYMHDYADLIYNSGIARRCTPIPFPIVIAIEPRTWLFSLTKQCMAFFMPLNSCLSSHRHFKFKSARYLVSPNISGQQESPLKAVSSWELLRACGFHCFIVIWWRGPFLRAHVHLLRHHQSGICDNSKN